MLSLEKTIDVNNLYFLAGAMRLPGGVDEPDNRPHFLTDAHIQKFKLGIEKFTNFDPNGISNIYMASKQKQPVSKVIKLN